MKKLSSNRSSERGSAGIKLILVLTVIGNDGANRLSHHLRGRITEHAFRGRVPQHHVPVGAERDDGVGGGFDDRAGGRVYLIPAA